MLHEESEFGDQAYLAGASGFLIARVCCIGAPLGLAGLALPWLILVFGGMSRLSCSILKIIEMYLNYIYIISLINYNIFNCF